MNQILGENIARLRKERDMTQEDLARELNISYQAVSKWENGISSPDISNIKLLAQLFGVSIDALFGMSLASEETVESPALPAEEAETTERTGFFSRESFGGACGADGTLPWGDDDTLRAVLFIGRRLLGEQEVRKSLFTKGVSLRYEGEARSVLSFFDVSCKSVSGNVEAGGDVDCSSVGGSVSAGGDVACESVGAAVNCGGDVNCGDVGGDIRAGGDVDCGTVIGSVTAGGDVDCGDVGRNVSAAGDVDCGRIGGGVFRE